MYLGIYYKKCSSRFSQKTTFLGTLFGKGPGTPLGGIFGALGVDFGRFWGIHLAPKTVPKNTSKKEPRRNSKNLQKKTCLGKEREAR